MLGRVWFETTSVEYDRLDLLSDPVKMQAKIYSCPRSANFRAFRSCGISAL